MERNVDFIIVGQGIAGSVLAQTLILKGKNVVVIDDQKLSQTSRIAAGLFNPVVFKRLVKSWLADELICSMDEFYPKAESILKGRFYFKKRIVKLFTEENEKNLWIKKRSEDVGKYLSQDFLEEFLPELLMDSLGASEVIYSGHVDSKVYLNLFRNYLKENQLLLEEKFDPIHLQLSEKSVTYKSIRANKLIFCEGHNSVSNPFFSSLPFKLTKGEILTVKIPALGDLDTVINKGVFILPLGEQLYKVGATYEWNELDEKITEKGKSELVQKLEKVLRVSFEIVDHKAGIRPTVSDRRPLIGLHAEHPQIGIFNGMGTKGMMLAPFFAEQFADFLEHGTPIHPEADIARFK
ncbi:MAG: FAD-binding oxidoreductase [Bacteroidota bacterium]|nr:FAD-binding oxidoreductase [Bacteroidota bacterium]